MPLGCRGACCAAPLRSPRRPCSQGAARAACLVPHWQLRPWRAAEREAATGATRAAAARAASRRRAVAAAAPGPPDARPDVDPSCTVLTCSRGMLMTKQARPAAQTRRPATPTAMDRRASRHRRALVAASSSTLDPGMLPKPAAVSRRCRGKMGCFARFGPCSHWKALYEAGINGNGCNHARGGRLEGPRGGRGRHAVTVDPAAQRRDCASCTCMQTAGHVGAATILATSPLQAKLRESTEFTCTGWDDAV